MTPPMSDPEGKRADRRHDLPTLVADLHDRPVNYREDQAPPHVVKGWHQDDVRVVLGHEEPGEIVEGGLA